MDKIKDDLRRMYDKDAYGYGAEYTTDAGAHFMQRKIKTALSLGNFAKNSHILEIGCANGSYTFELAKLGFKVTGVDLSGECINYAAEKAKRLRVYNAQFTAGDAEELSFFSDNTFDGAVSFSTLRYVPDPQKAVNEMFRVIKRHKTAVADFPNRLSPWFNYLKPWLTGRRHIYDHQYFTNEVKRFFRKAGFQEIKAKRILYTPKFVKPPLFDIIRLIEFVGELPVLNNLASIIMCGGKKP